MDCYVSKKGMTIRQEKKQFFLMIKILAETIQGGDREEKEQELGQPKVPRLYSSRSHTHCLVEECWMVTQRNTQKPVTQEGGMLVRFPNLLL